MRSGRRIRIALALASLLLSAGPVAAQTARGNLDTTTAVVDPCDALGAARAAQALFERRREAHLPVRYGSSSGECDEVVGRFCTWHDEGEWFPQPEPEELRVLRAELLAKLDSLQEVLPSEAWIAG